MRRAYRGVIARMIGSPAACQCAMPLVVIAFHCVTRKAAGQLVKQQQHADGDVDGLLRQKHLVHDVCSCQSSLPWSFWTSRTALECSQRARHGQREIIFVARRPVPVRTTY